MTVSKKKRLVLIDIFRLVFPEKSNEQAQVKSILEKDPPKSPEQLTSLKNELLILQHDVDTQNLLDLERKIGRAMDALKCPPGDKSVTKLSGVCDANLKKLTKRESEEELPFVDCYYNNQISSCSMNQQIISMQPRYVIDGLTSQQKGCLVGKIFE